MKILFVGDVHMDVANIENVILYAVGRGCKIIFVLGDFGYWPHIQDGIDFLARISELCSIHGVEVHFIRGNHDNAERLAEYPSDRISNIASGIYFHPNLTIFSAGGYRFCAVGGAYSVDGYKRVFGYSKWTGEEIASSEVYACSGIEADIVLSHDCPDSVDIDDYLHNKRDPGTLAHRIKLQAIVDEINPKYVFHGHYHERFVARGEVNGKKFINVGLASNEGSLATQCMVFDCDAMHHDFSVNYSSPSIID